MFEARDENENAHSNWRENLKQMARQISLLAEAFFSVLKRHV